MFPYVLKMFYLFILYQKGHNNVFLLSDYAGVCAAHKAMKNVASLINERKRRLESIDTIAHWQVAILHWAVSDITHIYTVFSIKHFF